MTKRMSVARFLAHDPVAEVERIALQGCTAFFFSKALSISL